MLSLSHRIIGTVYLRHAGSPKGNHRIWVNCITPLTLEPWPCTIRFSPVWSFKDTLRYHYAHDEEQWNAFTRWGNKLLLKRRGRLLTKNTTDEHHIKKLYLQQCCSEILCNFHKSNLYIKCVSFYHCFDHHSCHMMSWHIHTLYAIKLQCLMQWLKTLEH
jgi:hypothetical protein